MEGVQLFPSELRGWSTGASQLAEAWIGERPRAPGLDAPGMRSAERWRSENLPTGSGTCPLGRISCCFLFFGARAVRIMLCELEVEGRAIGQQ